MARHPNGKSGSIDYTYPGCGHTKRIYLSALKHTGRGGKISRVVFCSLACQRAHKLIKAKQVAEFKGGRCLSKIYENPFAPMRWECHRYHPFEDSYSNVVHGGRWCKLCYGHRKDEKRCLAVADALFRVRFVSKRPPWLLSPTGTRLELDGYNESMHLAFEYNGPLHDTPEAAERDAYKERVCGAHGIHLIPVPFTVLLEDMEAFIRTKAQALAITVPRIEPVDLTKLPMDDAEEDVLKILKFRKLRLLSPYHGLSRSHAIQCEICGYGKNGKWRKVLSNLKCQKGRGCPKCSGLLPITYDRFKDALSAEGWTIVSPPSQLKNAHSPMDVICAGGHPGSTNWNNFQQGKRCFLCHHAKLKTPKEKDDKVVAAYKAGNTMHQTAKMTGVPEGTIYSILKRHGVTRSRSEARKGYKMTNITKSKIRQNLPVNLCSRWNIRRGKPCICGRHIDYWLPRAQFFLTAPQV